MWHILGSFRHVKTVQKRRSGTWTRVATRSKSSTVGSDLCLAGLSPADKHFSDDAKQAERTKGSKGKGRLQVSRLCAFHYESLRQKHHGSQVICLTEPVSKAPAHSKEANTVQTEPRRQCVHCTAILFPSTASPVPSINALPKVLRQSHGFHGASEFCKS